MERRAYSILDIKSVDGDQYAIEGIASSPAVDRVGDIVEPLGAKFQLPLSLLWQHRHDQPVGHVTFAKATKAGIPFRATISKPSDFTSTVLRERALEAWESVKSGLGPRRLHRLPGPRLRGDEGGRLADQGVGMAGTQPRHRSGPAGSHHQPSQVNRYRPA
jgi:hypothetical protein